MGLRNRPSLSDKATPFTQRPLLLPRPHRSYRAIDTPHSSISHNKGYRLLHCTMSVLSMT